MNMSMGNMPRPKPDGPRRVRNGIRLRRKEGLENLGWPARDWATRLPIYDDPESLRLALEYGKSGQAVNFDVDSGRINSKVQCIAPKPHEVTIEFPGLNDTSWKRVLEQAAAGAIYSAKLLSGEFPEIVSEPFDAAGHPPDPLQRGGSNQLRLRTSFRTESVPTRGAGLDHSAGATGGDSRTRTASERAKRQVVPRRTAGSTNAHHSGGVTGPHQSRRRSAVFPGQFDREPTE